MRILLAIDGSEQSIQAAGLIGRLPFAEPPQVTVVSVTVDEQGAASLSAAMVQRRAVEQEKAETSFATVERQLREHGIPAEHLMVQGDPKREILKTAQTLGIDVIVLGDHGRSALSRTLLGSTCDYIVNHAACSVLVFRPGAEPAQQAEALQNFSALVAYDGSSEGQAAFAQAFEFAWPDSSQIRIAMLLERPALIADDEVYDQAGVTRAEDVAAQLAATSSCAAQVSYIVREAVDIGSGITALTHEHECDVVFLGGTGRSAVAQFFLGCVSRHVLHHAPCSVWIARPNGWPPRDNCAPSDAEPRPDDQGR